MTSVIPKSVAEKIRALHAKAGEALAAGQSYAVSDVFMEKADALERKWLTEEYEVWDSRL